MLKRAALALLLVAIPTLPTRAEIPCPVSLTTGRAAPDRIRLSFRNRGKVPVEQLSLACTPAPGPGLQNACHTENGIFYPGVPYWITILYPGADRHPVTIAVRSARVAGGDLWTARSSDSCRPLKIRRRP